MIGNVGGWNEGQRGAVTHGTRGIAARRLLTMGQMLITAALIRCCTLDHHRRAASVAARVASGDRPRTERDQQDQQELER